MANQNVDGQRVVARYADHRLIKGTTNDFYPDKGEFHIRPTGGVPEKVAVKDLKALFFVKTFEGDRFHVPLEFEQGAGSGRSIEVTFSDGEVLAGSTMGYNKTKPGFFLVPSDPESNNVRVFVVHAAVRSVRWL